MINVEKIVCMDRYCFELSTQRRETKCRGLDICLYLCDNHAEISDKNIKSVKETNKMWGELWDRATQREEIEEGIEVVKNPEGVGGLFR